MGWLRHRYVLGRRHFTQLYDTDVAKKVGLARASWTYVYWKVIYRLPKTDILTLIFKVQKEYVWSP